MSEELYICDGCNVRHPHEHRCHGQDCQCDNPICMNYQGRLSDEDYKKMVDDFISKGEEKSTSNTPSFLEPLSEFGKILDHADKAKK